MIAENRADAVVRVHFVLMRVQLLQPCLSFNQLPLIEAGIAIIAVLETFLHLIFDKRLKTNLRLILFLLQISVTAHIIYTLVLSLIIVKLATILIATEPKGVHHLTTMIG